MGVAGRGRRVSSCNIGDVSWPAVQIVLNHFIETAFVAISSCSPFFFFF